jgi:molybdate transport system substrate-binding protein
MKLGGEAIRRLVVVPCALSLALAACGTVAPNGPPETTGLTVFAAASLTDAFSEIGAAYEAANPGVSVRFSFAGSQTLRTQIAEGAPVDVFASANNKEMDALVTGGMVNPDAPRAFLSNKLVVIVPPKNPAALRTLQDLASPGLKLVLAAEEVPVGNYARQSLAKMNASFGANFSERVLANVVSNEDNIKQVVAKVQLGEADAGIVYTSDAIAASDLMTIEIPADLNVIATYPIAPLIGSAHWAQAADFVEYVLSPEGQAILKKWGFAAPGS